MQQTDELLLARAEVKETNRVQIIQSAPPNICSFKDDKKVKECLDTKFRLLEKTPDPYADMWDPAWINKKD